jgi:hypothetical protein
MYPFGWSSGERPLPTPKTFADFMTLSDDLLRVAIVYARHPLVYKRMLNTQYGKFLAANDDNFEDSMKPVFYHHPELIKMCRVWLDCDRDYVLARLTWGD